MAAARTTNDQGQVHFGVWLKGQYDITVTLPRASLPTDRGRAPLPAPTHALVVVEGAVGGRTELVVTVYAK